MRSIFELSVLILLCMMLYIVALKIVYDPDANKINRYGRVILIGAISIIIGSYVLHVLPKFLDITSLNF